MASLHERIVAAWISGRAAVSTQHGQAGVYPDYYVIKDAFAIADLVVQEYEKRLKKEIEALK